MESAKANTAHRLQSSAGNLALQKPAAEYGFLFISHTLSAACKVIWTIEMCKFIICISMLSPGPYSVAVQGTESPQTPAKGTVALSVVLEIASIVSLRSVSVPLSVYFSLSFQASLSLSVTTPTHLCLIISDVETTYHNKVAIF